MAIYKRLLFIINPSAGVQKKEGPLAEIIGTFSDHDYETIVCFTRTAGDASRLVKEHTGDGIDRIVCMGGDGTLNEVVSGCVEIGWDKPIGYIPAGSTNDFAASLGIPADAVKAAKRVMDGKPLALDVGVFNDRSFVYTASSGLFTKTSYETPQVIKNRLGHFAYVLEGAKDMSSLFKPNKMEICARTGQKEEVFRGEYILASVCNTFSLGGVMTFDSEVVSLQDGMFEILLIEQPKDMVSLNGIIRALNEQDYSLSDQVHFCKAAEAVIKCPDAPDWSLDGEHGIGKKVNEFHVIPRAVSILC